MFQNQPFGIKLIITILSFFLAGIVGWFVYSTFIASEAILVGIAMLFILTWLIIFCAFIFFQCFKYFRFPTGYYLKRRIESERFFLVLGVNLFRVILINSFFRLLNPRVYIKGEGREKFLRFIEETKQSETSHVFAFIGTILLQSLLFVQGYNWSSIALLFFNVLFNVYPILLQRMNRFAIEKRINKEN